MIEARNCSNCAHWRWNWPVPHKDGYVEAMCDQPPDVRDKTLKRGSDYCQHWTRGEHG